MGLDGKAALIWANSLSCATANFNDEQKTKRIGITMVFMVRLEGNRVMWVKEIKIEATKTKNAS